jgi:hypothetical protein
MGFLAGKTLFSDVGLNGRTIDTITGCEGVSKDESWLCRGYGAARRSFQPCIRTYNASVSAGVFNESVIEESASLLNWTLRSTHWTENNTTILNNFYAVLDLKCANRNEIDQLRALKLDSNSSD